MSKGQGKFFILKFHKWVVGWASANFMKKWRSDIIHKTRIKWRIRRTFCRRIQILNFWLNSILKNFSKILQFYERTLPITRNRVSPGLEPELELVEGAERSVDILFCDNVNSFWPVGWFVAPGLMSINIGPLFWPKIIYFSIYFIKINIRKNIYIFSNLKSTLLRSALARLPVLEDRDLFEMFQPE